MLEYRYDLLHVRAFLAWRKSSQSRIHPLYDGPSLSPWVRHQEGKTSWTSIWKKPGDKEYYTVNQLKKKCKKKDFQGIHDRFIQDQEFRNRMIEDQRDEDICRRWDVLADEDHTHHLTAQEYLYNKNKWCFIQINKVLILCHWGIDMVSNKHCLPCNDCNKKQEKNHRCLLTLTNTDIGRHAVHLLHGGIGKVHGGLLIIPKVKTEMHQVLSERSDLLLAVFGKILLQKTFMNSIYFVTYWSFTADGGLL